MGHGGAAPGGALPAGLRRLQELGYSLACLQLSRERNLRVVITVPTLRMAGVVAALGAVLADVACRDCGHRNLAVGKQVAGFVSGKGFVDGTLDGIDVDGLRFAGITLTGNRDSVHRLPAGFPERGDTPLSGGLRAERAAALGCSPELIGHRQSARCAHPVVVVGEPSVFREDVDCLATTASNLHISARLDTGHGLHDWFRHPALLMGTIPGPDEAPWAADLRPRLVIFTGSAGWNGSWRSHWPDVPVLALLSRRSPRACETAATIAAAGWPRAAALPPHIRWLAAPGDGLEVLSVIEPANISNDEEPW